MKSFWWKGESEKKREKKGEQTKSREGAERLSKVKLKT